MTGLNSLDLGETRVDDLAPIGQLVLLEPATFASSHRRQRGRTNRGAYRIG